LDADTYAREAVQLGSPVLKAITEHYGSDILLPDGTLNRQQLGQIVFSSLDETLVGTADSSLCAQYLQQSTLRHRNELSLQKYPSASTPEPVVLVVPLLFEAGMTDLVTEIWWCCSRQQQLERLMQRDQLTEEVAQARINSQLPTRKRACADVVLDNSSTPEAFIETSGCRRKILRLQGSVRGQRVVMGQGQGSVREGSVVRGFRSGPVLHVRYAYHIATIGGNVTNRTADCGIRSVWDGFFLFRPLLTHAALL